MARRPSSTREASAAARFSELRQLPISNQLGGYQSAFQYWGFYEPEYWRNYLHTHSFFEICYAYKGTGTFQINKRVRKIKAGDLFIARPGEEHEIISSRRDGLGIYYWAFSLTRGKLTGDPSPIDIVLEEFARSSQSVISNQKSTMATLKMLTAEIVDRAAGYPTVIQGLVAKLILDTARATVGAPGRAEQVDSPIRSEAEAVVANACRYIRDNLSRSISLRDVAAQVHLSERHLGRLFTQVKEMTVGDSITQMRMDQAAHLLLNQHWPVKKVAAAVGYPDVRYFTTLFRKRVKMTPAVFRRRQGTAFANEALRRKYD